MTYFCFCVITRISITMSTQRHRLTRTQKHRYREKAIFLSLMVKRIIRAKEDKRLISDKDFYGNKRLMLAGELMALLFEDLFKTVTTNIKRYVDKVLGKPNRASTFDVRGVRSLFSTLSTHSYHNTTRMLRKNLHSRFCGSNTGTSESHHVGAQCHEWIYQCVEQWKLGRETFQNGSERSHGDSDETFLHLSSRTHDSSSK